MKKKTLILTKKMNPKPKTETSRITISIEAQRIFQTNLAMNLLSQQAISLKQSGAAVTQTIANQTQIMTTARIIIIILITQKHNLNIPRIIITIISIATIT